MEYVSVEQARHMAGLRLVLTAGVPGPWGESAKGILSVKGLRYIPVRQMAGVEDPLLREWTGQTSAPVAIYDDEPPRCHWMDIILLAERLAPVPRLVPEAVDERALMFGLIREIAGEDGFGWCRRLQIFEPLMNAPTRMEGISSMAAKYGYRTEAVAASRERCKDILRALGSRLRQQASVGSRYFIGSDLTALDVYWAVFAEMISPLPAQDCPMPEPMREAYILRDPDVLGAVDPILMEHRDWIYRQHLRLPMEF